MGIAVLTVDSGPCSTTSRAAVGGATYYPTRQETKERLAHLLSLTTRDGSKNQAFPPARKARKSMATSHSSSRTRSSAASNNTAPVHPEGLAAPWPTTP